MSSFKYFEENGKTYLSIDNRRIIVRWEGRWVPSAEHIEPSNLCTIHFDANGGSGTMEDLILPKGSIIETPPKCEFIPPQDPPEKEFENWDDINGDYITFSYTVTEDTTFVAHWRVKE